MQKPSRATVKKTALAVGLVGGSVLAGVKLNEAVATFHHAKMDRLMALHLIAEVDKINPEVLTQAVETLEAGLAKATAAIPTVP